MNVLLILFNEPSEWLNSAAQFRFALVCLCFGRAFFLTTVWPVRDFFCLCRGAFCACNMYFLAPRVACVRVLQLLFSSECFNLFSYPHRSLLFIALPQASFDCLLLLLLPATCSLSLSVCPFLWFLHSWHDTRPQVCHGFRLPFDICRLADIKYERNSHFIVRYDD